MGETPYHVAAARIARRRKLLNERLQDCTSMIRNRIRMRTEGDGYRAWKQIGERISNVARRRVWSALRLVGRAGMRNLLEEAVEDARSND